LQVSSLYAGMRGDILALAQGFERKIAPAALAIAAGLRSHDYTECRLRLCWQVAEGHQPASRSLALCRLPLIQAALGKFVRGLQVLGGEIDAGSLRGRAVVIGNNPTGATPHSRRDHRCITVGDPRHTTTGCAHRGTVLGQPEEEEIGSKGGTDIGIKKLRPCRAASSC
jgi:hypothetical protein